MTRLLLIIKAEYLSSARAMAEDAPFSLTAEEAARMFVPAGSADGRPPATHYWASGVFTQEHGLALANLSSSLPGADMEDYDIQTDPTFPQRRLEELGLQRIVQTM
jgi:hypothetical protein